MTKFSPRFKRWADRSFRMVSGVLRLLWGGDAGRRAFFAFVLAVFGGWTFLALFTMLGGWDPIYLRWLHPCLCLAHDSWIGALLWVPPVLLLYAALATARLWWHVLKGSHRFFIGFWAVAFPVSCELIGSGTEVLPRAELLVPILLFFLLVYFPLLVYYRQWKLVLLRGAVWYLALLAMWRGLWNLRVLLHLFGHGSPDRFILSLPYPDEPLACLSLPLWLLGCWLTAKIVAGAAGLPWRNLFGWGTRTVLGVFAAVYMVSLGMAFAEHCRTERSVAELNARFGEPLTPATLRDRYYAGRRRADAGFWKRAVASGEKCNHNIEAEWITEEKPFAKHSPEELRKWRTQFESMTELKVLEEMFSAPPPPDVRDYCSGLMNYPSSEVDVLRDFCRNEAWRIRFAAEDGDVPEALAALRRLEVLSEYLAPDGLWRAQLIRLLIDNKRMEALEWLLDARMLPEAELRRQRGILEAGIREIPHRRKFMLLDAAAVLELFEFLAHGGWELGIPGVTKTTGAIYPYRWLFPPFWRLFSRNRGETVRDFGVDDLSQIDGRPKRNDAGRFLAEILVGTGTQGRKLNALGERQKRLLRRLDAEIQSKKVSSGK